MKKILFVLVLFFGFFTAKSQTFTVNHQIPWSTDYQNMWGPNGSPFSLDFDYNLFHFMYDSTETFGEIVNILGGDFGAEIDLDLYLEMGSTFSIHGFTTGSVDVDYPVNIKLDFPSAGQPVPGQYMTIKSTYSVLPGWDLSTHFPTAGVVTLDLDFGLNMDLSGELCFIDCAPISISNIDVPLDSIIIFELNSITGQVTYPCINGFLPAICQDTILPLVINNIGGIGLDLTADIPYIQTTDSLGSDKCLYAWGDDPYMTLSLDIIAFLSFMSNLIPPPTGPAISQMLAMLNGSFDLGYGISIDYSLLSAYLTLTNTLQQDLSFCPSIWTEMTYPIAMDYYVTNPLNSNDTVDTGTNDTIAFQAGHDLHVKWPCYGITDMDAGIRHYMHNDFTNHVWDSLAFDFTLTAFEFTINYPSFPVVPPAVLPAVCVEWPTQPGEPNAQLCTGDHEIEAVFAETRSSSIHIGPLVDFTIPLGYIPLTWYHNTWELAGFHDSIFPSVHLESGPFFSMNIQGDTVICFGENTGVIVASGVNGAAPYSFYWSTGATDSHNWPQDSIMVGSGLYTVTVSDGGGCTVSDSVLVIDNPEILLSLIKNDINCEGDSTGSISSNVSGGTPGYTYLWSPGGSTNQLIDQLPSGLYTLVVTDTVGCTKTDSILLVDLHPYPPVNILAEPSTGCQPLGVQFTETNPTAGNQYLWSFGDNTAGAFIANPWHVYDTTGLFDVTLSVTNQWNCTSTESWNDLIMVYPKPHASFIASPELSYTSENPSMIISFNNTSTGEISWWWNFDDIASGQNTSVLETPSHQYSDEGVYTVMLIVTSDLGCSDTAYAEVEIIDDILLFPNVMTPNNDGYNDFFVIDNVEKFPESKLTVFNRWGKVVYESTPYLNNWNGDDVSDGTYYFVFLYGRDGKEYKGSLTIIK